MWQRHRELVVSKWEYARIDPSERVRGPLPVEGHLTSTNKLRELSVYLGPWRKPVRREEAEAKLSQPANTKCESVRSRGATIGSCSQFDPFGGIAGLRPGRRSSIDRGLRVFQ